MISKTISGGQTGVDVAALKAARSLSIPTGGTMPRGYLTLDGPRPEYRELYGMVEHASDHYRPRTYANVRDSNFTIRLAVDFRTAGEKCTMGAISAHRKPYADVTIRRFHSGLGAVRHEAEAAIEKILFTAATAGRPIILNVAGNSERTAPGIEVAAEDILRRMLMILNKE